MSLTMGPGCVAYAITCDHSEHGQQVVQFPASEEEVPDKLPGGFHVSKLVAGIIVEVDGKPV